MISALLVALTFFFSCIDDQHEEAFNYLALGDSYTIGESVDKSLRWPVQLVNRLKEHDIMINEPKIIATTGWTTDELQTAMDEADIETNYDLVSLLIGVNNQYRGYPIDQFKEDFKILLEEAIIYAGGDTDKVIVLSIPDYGVTPFGQTKDPSKIKRELDLYNELKREMTESAGVKFYNITEASRIALSEPSLVAADGLHPSGKMYADWVDAVFVDVLSLLSR